MRAGIGLGKRPLFCNIMSKTVIAFGTKYPIYDAIFETGSSSYPRMIPVPEEINV